MKFTRYQIVKTKIADQDIKDINVVTELLKTLQKSVAYVIVEYIDSSTKHIKTYEQTKIKEVDNGLVTIIVYTRQGSMIIKDIKIEDMLRITLESEKVNIELGREVNRFDFLDL